AAYFTDPTTNRTEQRRFDLRVTKDPIHVYLIENDSYWEHNPALPLTFYVSTFYADGTPARCNVKVAFTESAEEREKRTTVATLRSNRYGLAKADHVQVPRDFKDLGDIDVVVSAVDASGGRGSKLQEFSLSEDPEIKVETAKAIYRPGEPLTAVITSNIAEQTIFVDVARKDVVIRTQQVQMHGGRVLVTFPYRSDFQNQISIAAYSYTPRYERAIDSQSVLYPENLELKVNAKPSQASYRPGEDAQVSFSVQGAHASSPQSALGVVVIDK